MPAGVNPLRKDAIVYDLDPSNKSASGWGHPLCAGTEADIARELGAGVGGSLGPMSCRAAAGAMRRGPRSRSLPGCCLLALLASRRSATAKQAAPAIAPAAAAAPPDDGQWTMPAKNYASTRYQRAGGDQ